MLFYIGMASVFADAGVNDCLILRSTYGYHLVACFCCNKGKG